MFCYDERTAETRRRLMGDREFNCFYYTDKYYHTAEGNFYYYTNSKGYIHAVKPCRVRETSEDGEIIFYTIHDYLLRKDDTVKLMKEWGYFKTREECIAKIEENLAPNDQFVMSYH